MRFVANFLLIILFVVLALSALLSGVFKFQLLSFNFWQKTFDKNNVYQNLARESRDYMEVQIGKEGGSKVDAKVLTELINSQNVKVFLDKNIQNVLSFANGKSPQLMVYIPIEKLPNGLLPRSLTGIQSEMTLKDLLTKFNYQNFQTLPLPAISRIGESANIVFVVSILLIVIILVLFFLLVESGGRFGAPGAAFLLTGSIVLFFGMLSGGIITSLGGLSINPTFASILTKNLLQPLVVEIFGIWKLVGTALLVAGLGLFFVKKPKYNVSK